MKVSSRAPDLGMSTRKVSLDLLAAIALELSAGKTALMELDLALGHAHVPRVGDLAPVRKGRERGQAKVSLRPRSCSAVG